MKTTVGQHTHRAIANKQEVWAFSQCLGKAFCNPSAHGGVVYFDRCRCGATRAINANQQYRESAGWREPVDG